MLFSLSFPIGSLALIYKQRSNTIDDEVVDKYGNFFNGIKVYQKSNPLNLLWAPFFIIKRLLIVLIIVFRTEISWL